MVNIRAKNVVPLLIVISALMLYTKSLLLNETSEVDIWVYDKVFCYAFIVLITLVVASYTLSFSMMARTLFVSILMIFIHIITPTIKYGFSIYNPFDTLSHMIFMAWISDQARIPYGEEVYYASLYGYTPLGNGVLPALLKIITGFSILQTYLTVFMVFEILLLFSFVILASSLISHSQGTFLIHDIKFKNTAWKYMLLILVFSMGYLPEWFASPVFAFIPLSFLTSLIIRDAFLKTRVRRANFVIYMVLFLYTSFSHLLASLYLLIFLISTFVTYFTITRTSTISYLRNSNSNNVIRMIMFLCLMFVLLSLPQHLYYNFAAQWYMRYFYRKIFEGEFEVPTEFSRFYRSPDIFRALTFLFGAYGKLALSAILQITLLVAEIVEVFKSKRQTSILDIFFVVLLIPSITLLILTYFMFFNRFEDLTRQVVFVGPLILSALFYYFDKKFLLIKKIREIKSMKTKIPEVFALLFVSILSSFLVTLNYGLPQVVQETCIDVETCFRPLIRTYVITPHAILSAEFVKEHITGETSLTVLITNLFPRNYIDIIWNRVKKQELILDIYHLESTNLTVEEVLYNKQKLLLFMPQSFNYVPSGPLGFDEPLKIINDICSKTVNTVYNNGGVNVYVK